MTEDGERQIAQTEEFFRELDRVCPDAREGLAISGVQPPRLTHAEIIAVLRSLPDNAGVDAFVEAWYAAKPAG